MNISELLADLQVRRDEATTRAGELHGQIEHLTTALAETEAHLADLATTAKVIAELVPAADQAESDPPETGTAYQAIVNAFNQHPNQEFRARELHHLLDMPTDEASVNVTRARLTRQGFLTQNPDEVATRNGLNAL
ncbi:hypothetical protein ABZT43_44365 [Streptomyces sp. NPDC005349]|uniref:hypothetical protein n=1 Tax=Streptomyces sp. NPDC005349 TaxID=3157037 RepID=UPI0033B33FE0